MYIYYSTTTSDKLSEVPLVNGQLIFVQDMGLEYYDMNGVRKLVSSVKLVDAFPSTSVAQEGVIYGMINSSGNIDAALWDSSASTFRMLSSPLATTSVAGLMSSSDKAKLNGIATGATANTGTVTSIATGAGLTGGDIITSGTIKANLKSETRLNNSSQSAAEVSDRVYPVALDKDGHLAVNVPWTDNALPSPEEFAQGYATDTRSSSASAVIASLSNYQLVTGGIVSIKFNYDVPANATLNINGQGAKPIYYKNSAISSNIIKAGYTATFIYSTQYHMISLDSAYTEISYQDWQNMSTAQQAVKDYFIPDYPNPSNTAAQVSYNNSNSGLASTQVQNAIDELANGSKVVVVSTNSISALPTTLNHASITNDMVVIKSILGTPSAQTSEWSITTGTGQLSISGTISGRTSLTLYLAKSRT